MLEPVRIAFVCHAVHSRRLGGADRSMIALIEALRRWEVRSLVCVPHESELTAELERREIPHVVVPYHNCTASRSARLPALGLMPGRLLVWPRVVCDAVRLRNALREWNPQIIYSNSVAVAAGRVAARMMRLPHVWHLRELPEPDRGVLPAWGWRWHKRLIRGSDRSVAISEAVATEFRAKAGGDPTVVYNGIGTAAEFSLWARRRKAPANGVSKLLLIGGFAASKGQRDAIHAVARARQGGRRVSLDLVGGGDENEVRREIEALNLHGAVNIRGRCPNPWDALARADCLLMCSTREPFGRVVVEAMAAGVPVIGRASGGVVEIIEDRRTGVLYDGSVDGLANAIAWVQDHPAELSVIASEAQRVAAARFSAEICGERIYKEVLAPLLRGDSTRSGDRVNDGGRGLAASAW